ncbi:hypothetical protein EJ06DRAFT_171280 [Trichodelitschia bisporula]|uniref:Uncharacterized protein n=1 Tax=Trichodelitschia bisporula TaxID=703511 RepID=A0A6G1HLQ0_9PEZI|nr:hypothetical protein EJ06DRAFT_171280 [Trichodelitschia bisporula]
MSYLARTPAPRPTHISPADDVEPHMPCRAPQALEDSTRNGTVAPIHLIAHRHLVFRSTRHKDRPEHPYQ